MGCGGVSRPPCPAAPAVARPVPQHGVPVTRTAADLESTSNDMQQRQLAFGLKVAQMNARTTAINGLLQSISESAHSKA